MQNVDFSDIQVFIVAFYKDLIRNLPQVQLSVKS